MKIGILTLTGSNNYGNVLQNYALQEVLSSFNADVETIENATTYGRFLLDEKQKNKLTAPYIKKYIFSQLNYRYNIKNTDTGILKQAIYYKKNSVLMKCIQQKRKEAIKNFCDSYIKKSNVCINVNKIPYEELQEFDYFVSGSDQVWNPTYPSTSMINFLQFAPEHKRVTFAPSFGINEIPSSLKEYYAKWLQEIPYLSVREEQGQKIIKQLTGRDAELVCDPTLVLSKASWEAIEEKPSFYNGEKYIFTYFLGNRSGEYKRYIDDIAKKNNLRVWHLFDIMEKDTYVVSPQEFLFLIHNAELVCTDSFHGTVFSIIFQSNFVSFPRIELGNTMGSRIETLLKKFSLQERDYRRLHEESVFNTDYSKAEDVIKKEQSVAIEFLKRALEKDSESVVEEKKEVYAHKVECCGCNACVLSCPQKCIFMQQDEEGFSYPNIDETKCIHCNRCHTVCPMTNMISFGVQKNECYAAYSKNAQVRYQSSSGGMFTELAEIVIDKGGVIFGAGFDENFKVKHLCITKKEEFFKLQGSKYVQSDVGDSYSRVREILEEGRMVYFSGTPCQIKGLHTYLKDKKCPNLITQDIVCHGVPSPLVWEKYVEAHKKNSKIKKISFRDKKYGWHYFSVVIKKDRKAYRKRLDEDWYMRLFLDNTILRPICHECPMKKEGSCADITLADCWNPTTVTNIKDDDKGLSLVNIHSTKGNDIWEALCKSGHVVTEKLDDNIALKSQSAIEKSAPINPKRHVFFEALQKEQFDKLQETWYRDNLISQMRRKYIFYKTKLYRVLLTVREKIKER